MPHNLEHRSTRLRRLTISAAALLTLAGTVPALAQPAVQPAGQPAGKQSGQPADGRKEGQTNAETLNDFLHFIRIDRMDLADAYGQQLLSQNIAPQQFVTLVESSVDLNRFEETIARAMRIGDAQGTAGGILKLYEKGKIERSRDPEQIRQSISMLTGTSRGRDIARRRLLAAGEYAMPQLLAALLDASQPAMQSQVRQLLTELGRQAVMPLAVAMSSLDPVGQETVANVLGTIPYRTSLPFLFDLRDHAGTDPVKRAAELAITRIEGTAAPTANVADLYLQLGEAYYARRSELTSFPGEDFQLVWKYVPASGLVMTAVRTAVYYEAMAMWSAEHAMALAPDNADALGLWVAANLSREINTPEGYQNPVYGADRREAMYYAVASGSATCQRVLGRAIDRRDTPLARRAISALEKTAGGAALWSGEGDRRPLLEALGYPNRRVQYDASLALAAAQPSETFAGAERVVPILAGAIRDSSVHIAAAVAPDAETYQLLRRVLESRGYTVLSAARNLDELAGPVAEAPNVDLLMIADQKGQQLPETIQMIRGNPKLSATPVLVLTSTDAYTELRRRYERDNSVAIRPSSISEETIGKAADELVQVAAGGPISEKEAMLYSARSLAALRDLAISGNRVFDVSEAATPLLAVLADQKLAASGAVSRLAVADVLTRIPQERVQTALMDAALAASGNDRIAMFSKVADSAKRYGSLLPKRQVDRLVEIAGGEKGAEATAAAALLGALNLPNSQIVPLILRESK